MSEKVYYGDEWKHADDATRSTVVKLRSRTRSEQQAWFDDQYGHGKITREQWRMFTDRLSYCDAAGNSYAEAA